MPQATNYTYGGRIGGPIILPGFDGRGRAFFFFNQEEVYNPIETSADPHDHPPVGAGRQLHVRPDGAPTTVNVMALANASRRPIRAHDVGGVYDPTIKALLESIARPRRRPGTITELVTIPNTATYRVPVADQDDPPRADDEHHGEPDAEAPPAGVVLLAAVQATTRTR